MQRDYIDVLYAAGRFSKSHSRRGSL